MDDHMETCFTYGGCKVNMPVIGKNTIEFTQYYNQQVAPYINYADFEAIMNKISEEKTIHEISPLLWYHHIKDHKLNITEGMMQEKFLQQKFKN